MFSHIQQLNRFAHQSMLNRAELKIRLNQAAASRLANFVAKLAAKIPAELKPNQGIEKMEYEFEPPSPSSIRQDRVMQAAKSDMPALPTLTSIEGYREVLANKTRIF